LTRAARRPRPAARARRERRRRSFDGCAALYERARPGYPPRLFDDLVRLAGLRRGARVLEIGPGPGTATLPLARRGFRILAVELSPAMARRCRRNLRRFPAVRVLNLPFEDWPVQAGAFDLVVAATAFHWLNPRLGYCRAAAALRPGGWFALVWNARQPVAGRLGRELRAVYRELGLEAWGRARPGRGIRRRVDSVRRSGRFGRVRVRRYPWTRTYTVAEHLDLLRTMSDHAIMDGGVRRRLFRRLRQVLDRHGGTCVHRHLAVLLLARRA
jgi:SAM-dependent methyltransferase